MRVLNIEVTEEEHSVERFHEELDLGKMSWVWMEGHAKTKAYQHVCCEENRETNIVWCIGFLLFHDMISR